VSGAAKTGASTSTATAKRAADVVRGLTEIDALSIVIWGEARAETPDGQIAVGQVVLNRLRSGHWGHTVVEVVTSRSQFSCLWPWGGKDNHERVMATAEALVRGEAVASESFRQCRWIAAGLLDGVVMRDLTHGASHYLTTDLLKSGLAPGWAKSWQQTAVVGRHAFGVTA